MLIRGKVKEIKDLDVSPLDVMRILLPLLSAQLSFNYGLAAEFTTGLPMFLPCGLKKLAQICATGLWRRLWDALKQTEKSSRNAVLEDFLDCSFLMEVTSDGAKRGTYNTVYFYYRGDAPQLAHNAADEVFGYAFHSLAHFKIGGESRSDIAFENILTAPMMITTGFYGIEAFHGMLQNLMCRFNFLDWKEMKLLHMLNVNDLKKLMEILLPFANRHGCICISARVLCKKLAKEMGISRKEAKLLMQSLCNEDYARLLPVFAEPLKNEVSSGIDKELANAIVKTDDLAGPYKGREVLPFIQIRGFVFTSLWLLHYLAVCDLFEKTKEFWLQRGFSLETFVAAFLKDYGFQTKTPLKWIVRPVIKGKAKLEINVAAYKEGKFVMIQCKSYMRQAWKNKISKIKHDAKLWREAAEYLSKNLSDLTECVRRADYGLFSSIEKRGIEIIVPTVVTEVDDY